MITVYELLHDYKNFQHLLIDEPGFTRKFRCVGQSFQKIWSPPKAYSPAPKLKLPDFWDLVPYSGFALSRQLFLTLPILQQTGEILTLSFDDHEAPIYRDIVFFNLTNIVDCLDKERSDFNPRLASVDKFVFKPENFNQSIFRVPETPSYLAVEGLVPEQHEFKSNVEKRNLKGLTFRKVWSEADSC